MKKTAFIFGAISTSTIGIGLLFKTLHIPYGNLILALGLLLFALIFTPTIFKYLYDTSS